MRALNRNILSHVDVNHTWESRTQVKEKAYITICDEIHDAKRMLEVERQQAQASTKKLAAELAARQVEIRCQADHIGELRTEASEQQEKVRKVEEEMEELRAQEGGEDAQEIEQKLNAAVAVKEEGYQHLVDDFVTMQQKSHEEIAKMRSEFSTIVHSLEVDAKVLEEKARKKRLYLEEQMALKVRDARELRETLTELREKTEEERHRMETELAETTRELRTAHEVIRQMNVKEERKLKTVKDGADTGVKDERIARMKAMRLEKDMREMSKEAQSLLSSKDGEIQDLMKGNARLQNQLVVQREKYANLDTTWDERFQVKERVMDDLREDIVTVEEKMKREGQVSESLREELKGKQNQFVVLDIAYRKQIAARMYVEEQLQKEKEVLERQIQVEIEKQAEIRQHFAAILEKERIEKETMEEEFEAEIAELKEVLEKKELMFQKTSAELIAVREEMDEKEREADAKIKDLGRKLQALQAEMNFSLEMAEEKYQRLLRDLQRLQEKYDREMALGNVNEMKERISALQKEVKQLQGKIAELNATIAQLHLDIREHVFEIEETRRETADLLFTKENAYRDMCAQIPPLEQRIADEKLRRERDLEEKDKEYKLLQKSVKLQLLEKDAVVASLRFNDRDDLLAQIGKWKQRFVCERDKIVQIEIRYEDLIGKQHQAALVVTDENAQLRTTLKAEKLMLPAAQEKHEKVVASMNIKYDIDVAAKVEACNVLQAQIEELNHRFSSEMDALSKEPAYVQEYRETIAKQGRELEIAEEGRKLIVEDEARKMLELAAIRKEIVRAKEDCATQLREANLNVQKADMQYEDIKQALTRELEAAEATCRAMEQQMRNLPDPMDEDLAPMKEEIRMMAYIRGQI